jgi:predicted amidohydrolase
VDRSLLALLLAGLTDQAIAGQLGIGLRSVQRRVHDLMAQTGAQTRIQLGWHAARKDWLASDRASQPARVGELTMRIALCQIPVSPDPSLNLSRVRGALKEAADGKAELAVFPEATMVRFGSDLRAAAEPVDGPFCSGMAGACLETGVAAVAGIFEPAPGGRVYNTAVAFSGDGTLIASYRKLHLFDALGQRESDVVAPGSAPVIAALAGVQAGLEICYDIRFPELSRALAAGGAQLLVVSAAWAAGLFKEEHWVTLLRARAIENTVWIAAAGQVPDVEAPPTRAPTGVGRSMLIDPMGVVRLDLGPSPCVSVAEADLALVDSVRATLPSLANRRHDIFR